MKVTERQLIIGSLYKEPNDKYKLSI